MENRFDIYVINLDKDRERLDRITKSLYPNTFIRIPAIYGSDTNFENNQDIFFPSRYLVPKNTLACNLSHRAAIEKFIKTSNKEYGLILEDDAIPVKDYNEKISNALDNFNQSNALDIIKLDYAPIIFKSTHLPSVLATAYLIKKNTGQKILDKKIYYHYDFELNFFNDIKIYNNHEIVFYQSWALNDSNNKIYNNNPLSYFFSDYGDFKALRLSNTEFTINDLLIFIVLVLVIIYYIYKKK